MHYETDMEIIDSKAFCSGDSKFSVYTLKCKVCGRKREITSSMLPLMVENTFKCLDKHFPISTVKSVKEGSVNG